MKDKEHTISPSEGFNLKGTEGSKFELLKKRGAELIQTFALESRQLLIAKGVNPDDELAKAKEKYGDSFFFD